MMDDDDNDTDLLRTWRDAPQVAPGELIDRRVLKAAEEQRRRRRGVPLAVALAACLMLAIYSMRTPLVTAPPAPAQLDTSSFGLYEGRDDAHAATAKLHDAPVNTGFSAP